MEWGEREEGRMEIHRVKNDGYGGRRDVVPMNVLVEVEYRVDER